MDSHLNFSLLQSTMGTYYKCQRLISLKEQTKSLIITSVMSPEIYYHPFLFFSYCIGTYIVTSTGINFLEFMETQKEHGMFLQSAVTRKLRSPAAGNDLCDEMPALVIPNW